MEVVHSDRGTGLSDIGVMQKIFRWLKNLFGTLATKDFWMDVIQKLAQSAAVSILSAAGAVLGNVAKEFVTGNKSGVIAGTSPVGQAASAYAGSATSSAVGGYSQPSRSATPVMQSSRQGAPAFPGFG